MTPEITKRIEELAVEGCCAGTVNGPCDMSCPAGPIWAEGANVYWVELGAESQQHVHRIKVASAELLSGGRDLKLTNTAGMDWYFVPSEIAGDIDLDVWRQAWGRYRAFVSTEEGRQSVREFLRDAIGSAPSIF